MHNDHRELLLEELRSRGMQVKNKEKVTVLKKLLINNECPNPTIDPNEKTFFLPKFLTATDWMKDNLSETLAKIVGVRLERSSD